MKPPESNSIRRQLEVSLTLAVALLFTAGALGVYLFVRADVNRQFVDKLEKHLEGFVDGLEMDVEGDVDAPFHELALMAFDPTEDPGTGDPEEDEDEEEEEEEEFEDATWYVLRDFEGKVLVASPWLKDPSAIPFEPLSEEDAVSFGRVLLEGGKYRMRTAATSWQLPLEILDPEEIGVVDSSPTDGYNPAAPENRVHLTIAESDREVDHLLAVLALGLTVTGVVIVFVMALLLVRLVKRACLPIETISEMTASIDPEHLDTRLPEGAAPAELEPLVRQFNALLERVESAFTRERRFSADIAHELRTPVTELRSLAEVALEPSTGNDDSSEEDPETVYREVAAIGQRMSHLIEILSALHRAESGSGDVRRETVSLFEVLDHAVAAAAAIAESRDVSIEIRSNGSADSRPEESRIVTDPALLRGILDNLIGNAAAYATPGSVVGCHLCGNSDRDNLNLEIHNATERLGPEDLAHLNEPFWQKDAARSETTHFGLGLSTVAAYARLLEMRVRYRLDDGNFIAELTLPRAK